MAKKKAGVPPKLTDPELDLLANMEHGYQLETDSLCGSSFYAVLENDKVIRPVFMNRNTIKAMKERGSIKPAKGQDPLTSVWRLTKKAK